MFVVSPRISKVHPAPIETVRAYLFSGIDVNTCMINTVSALSAQEAAFWDDLGL